MGAEKISKNLSSPSNNREISNDKSDILFDDDSFSNDLSQIPPNIDTSKIREIIEDDDTDIEEVIGDSLDDSKNTKIDNEILDETNDGEASISANAITAITDNASDGNFNRECQDSNNVEIYEISSNEHSNTVEFVGEEKVEFKSDENFLKHENLDSLESRDVNDEYNINVADLVNNENQESNLGNLQTQVFHIDSNENEGESNKNVNEKIEGNYNIFIMYLLLTHGIFLVS